MTREQVLLELQQKYACRREENLRLYEQKTEEACQRCPGLRELLEARHVAVLNGMRSALLRQEKDPDANKELPSAMVLMNRKIAEALKAGGLPKDALQPIYTCALCRDEGYVYEPSRKMCQCLQRELNERMLSELGLQEDRQTFENFDESVFSDEAVMGGVSQRQMALLAKKVCMAYADSFPDTGTPNLLLTGKSGLGKTYLLRSIAHRMVSRGILPNYTSAYHLLEVARRAYMENNSDRLAGFMHTPLLLIDDLGTEPLMQNITVTQLFNLLNERQMSGKHTVISTNLDISELKERYTERISSRLMDGTCWRKLALTGEDVRKRLKRG